MNDCPFPPKHVVTAPYPVGDQVGVVLVTVCSMHLAEVREYLAIIDVPEIMPIDLHDQVEELAEQAFPGQVYRLVPAAA